MQRSIFLNPSRYSEMWRDTTSRVRFETKSGEISKLTKIKNSNHLHGYNFWTTNKFENIMQMNFFKKGMA